MIKNKMSSTRRQTRPMRNDPLAALMTSAKSGDPDLIRHKASALRKDLNLLYPGGRTLLTKAIEDNEKLSTVEAIIKSGANVDVQNMQGKSALMVAIMVRRFDVLKVLLESGANQDLVTHKNSSVFSQCLKEGLFSYLEILLKNVSGTVSICEKIHEMALFIKQSEKKFTTKNRSHIGVADLTPKQGIVQAIKNGCSVNCTDETGTTPLMHAVKCHYDDCVRLLLLAGADVNKINKRKETALTLAMTRGANPVLPDLIMAGAFIKHPRSKTSSMHFEMFKKIIDCLQQNGLLNIQDIHGKTALMYAAERGDRNCIMYAIEADIDEFVKIEFLPERKNSSVGCVHVCDDAGLFSSICKCKEPEESRCEDCDKYATEQMRIHKDKNGRPLLMYAFETGRRLPDSYIQLRACDDAGYRDENGRTVLMNFFKFYQQNAGVYMTQALLNKASPELLETLSFFKYAFEISYKSITKLFGGQVNIRDNEGNPTVIYAIKYYEFITEEIVELLVGDTQKEQYEDGKTALMIALQAYKDQAPRYIKPLIGDSFNIQNKEGKTALMYALTNTRVLPENLMELMIGDSQNVQDKDGKTGLMYAILCENDFSDNLIIQMIGDSQNIQDNEGKTALMYAILSKRYFSENLIIQMIGYSQNVQDNDGKTALMYAILSKGYISDKLIIQMLGDSQNLQDNDGKTALMYAFIHNLQLYEETIEQLAGENPFIQDKNGKTALMFAFQFNQRLEYKSINALFRGKVNIRDNEGHTTVIYAVQYCTYLNEEVTNLLVGDTQKTQYKDGKTALMIALQNDKLCYGIYYFIHPLIGSSCNVQDNEGKTALMYAIKHNRNLPHHSIKQMLRDSLHIHDNEGKTAFMYAMKHKRNLSDHLIKKMISESQYVQDKEGKTALIYASQNSNFSNTLIIKLFSRDLLNVQDTLGKTALHYAIEHNQNDEYLKNLIAHGANLEIEDNKGKTALISCIEIDTRANVTLYGGREYFLKTKMFLQYNPLPRLNPKGKIFLFTSIGKEMLTFLNLYKNKEILRLMFVNGVVPFPNSCSKFSTLFGVLKHNLLDVSKYVITNMCLTNDDLKMLNNAKNCLKSKCCVSNPPSVYNLNGLDLSSPELQHLVIGATSQPWPLVKLSFIAVNSAVVHGVDRERRIEMLPLPNPIKDMLMFNTRTALLPVSEWASIPMVFDLAEYEKTSRPRPLLNYWPFGEVLVV